MTTPPPTGRSRGPRGGHTKSPPLPPAPPRWHTTSHDFRQNGPYLQIEIGSDFPNRLTLAYTYTKPDQNIRNLVRYGVARPHHISYQLREFSLAYQVQTPPGTMHTFEIPFLANCHKVYYAAFDGTNPLTFHSISPIFAIEYCANGAPFPTTTYWAFIGRPFDLQTGDFLFVSTQGNDEASVTVPPSTFYTTTLLLPPTELTSHPWTNLPAPPWHPYDTFTNWYTSFILHFINPPPAFDPGYAGLAIRGAPNLTPGSPTLSLAAYPFIEPPSPDAKAFTIPNFSLISQYAIVNAIEALPRGANNPDPSWSNQLANFFEHPGPVGAFTKEISGVSGDGYVALSGANFERGQAVTTIADITKLWRKLPGTAE